MSKWNGDVRVVVRQYSWGAMKTSSFARDTNEYMMTITIFYSYQLHLECGYFAWRIYETKFNNSSQSKRTEQTSLCARVLRYQQSPEKRKRNSVETEAEITDNIYDSWLGHCLWRSLCFCLKDMAIVKDVRTRKHILRGQHSPSSNESWNQEQYTVLNTL